MRTYTDLFCEPGDQPEIYEGGIRIGRVKFYATEPECAERLARALLQWADEERERRHLDLAAEEDARARALEKAS